METVSPQDLDEPFKPLLEDPWRHHRRLLHHGATISQWEGPNHWDASSINTKYTWHGMTTSLPLPWSVKSLKSKESKMNNVVQWIFKAKQLNSWYDRWLAPLAMQAHLLLREGQRAEQTSSFLYVHNLRHIKFQSNLFLLLKSSSRQKTRKF